MSAGLKVLSVVVEIFPHPFSPDIAPSRMFTTKSLCLIICPIHEWRLLFKIFNSKTNQKLKDKKKKMCKCTLNQAWVSAAPRSCSAVGCYVGPVFRGWYAFFSVVLTAEESSMIFLYNIYIHQLDYIQNITLWVLTAVKLPDLKENIVCFL
jgi:hypothetical protein